MPALGWAQSIDAIRIATFAAPLSRDGPGLLLRDILKGQDAQIAAIVGVIDQTAPDILVLTDFDFDAGGGLLSLRSPGPLPHPIRTALLLFRMRASKRVWIWMGTGLPAMRVMPWDTADSWATAEW